MGGVKHTSEACSPILVQGASPSCTYDELVARDKANLDITWLRDDSLEDLENLPSPDVLAREIVEDLAAALAEFEAVATALEKQFGQDLH